MSEDSLKYLYQKKVTSIQEHSDSRELNIFDPKKNVEILFIRSKDVGTYVEQGAVDLGIIGYDLIQEWSYQVFIPLKLPFGKCRLSVAYLKGHDLWKQRKKVRVATKYPHLASDFFYFKGYNVEIIELYGSIEIAPLTQISDVIVDLVSTGKTLKANRLVEDQVILESQASLVVNPRIYFYKRDVLNATIDKLL